MYVKMTTLEYYFENGAHVIFEKYTIDEYGVIRNKTTGNTVNAHKSGNYNRVAIQNESGKQSKLLVGRALLSTFEGRPSNAKHTADHIDRNPNNDTLENLRWLCNKGQRDNRFTPDTQKSAFIIVKDGVEKTIKEWVNHLKDEKNPYGREYTDSMIEKYIQKKQFGFSYKEYPDIPGEVWKEIANSESNKGRWEISNMCRIKFVTKFAENVLSGKRLNTHKGYPRIALGLCHILAFKTFYPDEYTAKKPREVIMHENDDKMDFMPDNLRLGTHSDNGTGAHDNGSYKGTESERKRCASYISDVLEKEHNSQNDATKYLKSIGFGKVNCGNISFALNGKYKTAYGRVWKYVNDL